MRFSASVRKRLLPQLKMVSCRALFSAKISALLVVAMPPAIDAAVDQILADPARRTCDIGGNCSTTEFANTVAAALETAG